MPPSGTAESLYSDEVEYGMIKTATRPPTGRQEIFDSDPVRRIEQVIDNHIGVWSTRPAFEPLAEIVQKDRQTLSEQISFLLDQGSESLGPESDDVRSFILHYALERAADSLDVRHFTLFKEAETVQIILEDSFGVECGVEEDRIVIPYQNEVLGIVVRCLFCKRPKSIDSKDVACFLRLFCGATDQIGPDQDRTMRYKSMVWLAYLAIELIKVEKYVCLNGIEYFRQKFRDLLDRALQSGIINENSREPGFDGGKWEDTLYGWLQGEDRQQFLLKLIRQFNLENRMEHANRLLLAEHRKCVFEQVMALFC